MQLAHGVSQSLRPSPAVQLFTPNQAFQTPVRDTHLLTAIPTRSKHARGTPQYPNSSKNLCLDTELSMASIFHTPGSPVYLYTSPVENQSRHITQARTRKTTRGQQTLSRASTIKHRESASPEPHASPPTYIHGKPWKPATLWRRDRSFAIAVDLTLYSAHEYSRENLRLTIRRCSCCWCRCSEGKKPEPKRRRKRKSAVSQGHVYSIRASVAYGIHLYIPTTAIPGDGYNFFGVTKCCVCTRRVFHGAMTREH